MLTANQSRNLIAPLSYRRSAGYGKTAISLASQFRFAGGAHHPDAKRAFEVQRERAAKNGQQWSDRHAHAIRELQEAYVLTGLGMTEGRTAWPLAVGVGKSESVVAFVRAQYERQQRGAQPLSLLVCMERAVQLRDLYEVILSTGVPASFVGVYHRMGAADIKSERLPIPVSLSEASTFPVLLATHAKMLRGEAGISDVNTYRDGARSLVVWDESLIKSRGHHLDLAMVEQAAAVLSVPLSGPPTPELQDAHDARSFIVGRLALLRASFAAQSGGSPVEPIPPASLSESDELRFVTALSEVLRRGGHMTAGALAVLTDFLEHSARPARVLEYRETGRKAGVIHFDTLIPASLRRLIVLDASHNVRLLTSRHDTDLHVSPVDCAVKSFEGVTVRCLKRGAGRSTLQAALSRRGSVLLQEIVAEIRSWPADQSSLIVTFKQDARDARKGRLSFIEYLREAMSDAGLDPDATLPDGRPRYNFITWGQHLAVNHYAHCQNVLLVGVLRRSQLDLASAIAGQQGNLVTADAADAEQVKAVELSEMFHNVVQAAGRGSCRNTVDGRALPMTLSVLCSDEFPAEWWQSAMPGVRVTPWNPTEATQERVLGEREAAIVKALSGLSPGVASVSTAALKSVAGLAGLSKDAYGRAVARAAAVVKDWRKEGRSFHRVEFGPVPATD